MNPAHDPAQWAQSFAYWQKHGDWDGTLFEARLNALNSAMIAAPPDTFDVNAFLSGLLQPHYAASPTSPDGSADAQEARQPAASSPVELPATVVPLAASPPIETPSISVVSLPLSGMASGSTPATTPAQPTPAAANNHHRGTPQPHSKAAQPSATPTHSSPIRDGAGAGLLKRRRVTGTDESLPPAKKVQVAVPVNVATPGPVAGPSVQRPQVSHWHKHAHRSAPVPAVANGSRVTGSSMFQVPSLTPAAFPHQYSAPYPYQAHGMSATAGTSNGTPSAPAPLRPPPDKGPDHMRPAKGSGVKTHRPAPFSNEFYCDECHQAYEPRAVWYTSRGLEQHKKKVHL